MSGSGIREFPRHRLVKRVKVKCGSWDAAAQLYTQNISRGGMFVRTPTPGEIGSSVEVVVTLPDGAQSTLVGEVVRVVGPEEAARTGAVAGMGLRFGQLAPADVERLERLIDLARSDAPEEEVALPKGPSPAAAPPAKIPVDLDLGEISLGLGAAAPAPAPAPAPAAAAPLAYTPPGQRPPQAPQRPLDADSLFGDLDAPSPSMVAPSPLAMAALAQPGAATPQPTTTPAPAAADGSSSISQVLSIESAQAYMRASDAYAQGQYAEARMVAGSAVRSDPRNRELRTLYLLAYARELLAADRKQEGIVQLQAVLKLDYKNQEAITLLRSLGHA